MDSGFYFRAKVTTKFHNCKTLSTLHKLFIFPKFSNMYKNKNVWLTHLHPNVSILLFF